jgi:hemoglobin/transferrin/lactoferrin receptor protein
MLRTLSIPVATVRRQALTTLFAATTALTPCIAAAQEQQREGVFAILGRVVLGFGTPKVASDTPLAVTVLDQEDLDREPASTVRGIFDGIPGVQTAGSTARPLGFAFNIRGVGNTEQPASESRIIVTVDGVPKFYEQYRMGSFFSDPELYKRVEVLRGPAAGTLYGSGAIGGIINFTTKDASDFLEDGDTSALRFRLGYGSNGDSALASAIYAIRPSDSFEVLGALNYRRSGDVKDGDGTVIDGTGYGTPSGLLKGTWTLGGGQKLRFSLQRWTSDEDDARYAQTGSSAFGTVDRRVVDTTALLSFSDDVPDNPLLDYTFSLGFSDTTNDQTNANPGFPSTSVLFQDTSYGYRTVTLKAQNRSEFSGPGWEGSLVLGVDVSQLERTSRAASGVNIGFHPEGTDRRLAVYGQGEFVFGERLTIIPGLRADFVNRTPGPLVPGATETDDVAVSAKIAALYDITEDLAVFASYATTERLPTLDELYSSQVSPTVQAPALNLEKEKSESVELGLAYDREGVFGQDDALQLKLTAFRNDVDNLIERSPSTVPVYFRNIGAARFEGVELEGSYEAPGGYVRLAYSHVRGTDTDFDYTLSSTPADSLSLTLARRLPDIGLELGWTAHFVDSISTSSRNATTGVITTTDFAAYDVHDLFVNWTPERGALAGTDVRFGVENVFDKTYRNNLDQENGTGRTIKLTLTRTF